MRPAPGSAALHESEPAPRWLDVASFVTAFASPLVFAVAQAGILPEWRSDARFVSSLSGSWGAQGAISDLLVQLWMTLPIGSCVLRSAWASSVALGVLGCLVFVAARGVLAAFSRAPRTSLLLATLAALTATLAPTPLREGSSVGGGAMAAALAMGLIVQYDRASRKRDASWIGLGAILGVLCVESVWVGAITVLAILMRAKVSGPMPLPRSLRASGLSAAAVAGWVILPPLIHTLATEGARAAVTKAVLGSSPTAATVVGTAIGVFGRELGTLTLAFAAIGACIAIARRDTRASAVVLVVLVAGDALVSSIPNRLLSGCHASGLHLLAIAALAIAGAAALAQMSDLIAAMRVRASRGALVFLVMFDLALVAASAEEAAFVPPASAGAERFSDEAFEQLPPSSVVLIRSRPLFDRLNASRTAFGSRPDVALVPYLPITTASAALSLLQQRPYLADILRDLAMENRPLERSLASLADKRPVFVELDSAWDRRIVSHLVPDHLWFRFHAEPRGASERRAGFAVERDRLDAIVESSRGERALDPDTVGSALIVLKSYAVLARDLGDRETLAELSLRLATLAPDDPFVAELSLKTGARPR